MKCPYKTLKVVHAAATANVLCACEAPLLFGRRFFQLISRMQQLYNVDYVLHSNILPTILAYIMELIKTFLFLRLCFYFGMSLFMLNIINNSQFFVYIKGNIYQQRLKLQYVDN